MSKGFRAGALCALAMLWWIPQAGAAVDQGPHDLGSQGYVVKGEGQLPEKCTFCHIPRKMGDQAPWAEAPPSVSYYSRSGLLCYSCHDGTTIVSGFVDASQGAYHPNAHTMKPSDRIMPRYESGQPELLLRNDQIECVTCHNPHENSIRPFQRVEAALLCAICHPDRNNKGYGQGNQSGGHPVHETLEDDAGGSSPIEAQAPFTVPYPTAYPTARGRETPGVHWNRGGHLAGGEKGTIECFTCHAVHGTDRAAPLPRLLSMDPVRETADLFCEGCHRGPRGDGESSALFPNPGGTTTGRTYHPCDDDLSNGPGRKVAIRENVPWPLSRTGSIMCSTCHVPHGGAKGTAALRKPELATTFCEECHQPESQVFHHPSGATQPGDSACPLPQDIPFLDASGRLTCGSCHVAHNAGIKLIEANYVPILRFAKNDDALCSMCHGEGDVLCDGKGTASHFLGDPTLPTTYAQDNPPLRILEWPLTKLKSLYGGANQKKVICLSCHVFRNGPGSLLVKPLPHYLLANAGNEYEWENDPGVYLCTGCHSEDPSTYKSGHTHPLMRAQVVALGTEPLLPATYTVNGHLNCDSCHRAHGAVTASGYYILEKVDSPNLDRKKIHPDIDYTSLCHLCHIGK